MLRFYARPGHVCPWPGQRFSGQLRNYIGRDAKIERNDAGDVSLIGHPASKEAAEVDPASKSGRRILRLFRIEEEKPLIPADEATARVCGVPFVDSEWVDGEFYPKAAVVSTPQLAPDSEPAPSPAKPRKGK